MKFTIIALLLVMGCRSSYESTESIQRDTVIVFYPLPVDTTYVVEGSIPTGILNPECDTLEILARYADFNLVAADTFYNLLAKYTAKDRRLRILENRPAEKVPVTVEYYYKEHKIVKDSFFDRLGQWGIGAMAMLGLCIVAAVVLKFKGVL